MHNIVEIHFVKLQTYQTSNMSNRLFARSTVRTAGLLGPRMDDHTAAAGSFIVVEVPECGGLGWQAQRNLRVGTVLLRERPIAILRASSLHEALATDAALDQLSQMARAEQEQSATDRWADSCWRLRPKLASAQVIERFAQLAYDRLPSRAQQRWMALVDSFSLPPAKTPGNVVRSNAFTNAEAGDNLLFEIMSRANHSCAPNMHRAFDGDAVVVSTACDVPLGSALTISYLSDRDLALSTPRRRELLQERFNFLCECERCLSAPTGSEAPISRRGPTDALAPPASDGDDRARLGDTCKSAEGLVSALSSSSAARAFSDALQVAHPTRNRSHMHGTVVNAIDVAEGAVSWQLRACAAMLADVGSGERMGLDMHLGAGLGSATASAPLLTAIQACADTLQVLARVRRTFGGREA